MALTATAASEDNAEPAAPPCPASVTEGEMPGRYDFTAVEQDLYSWWESSGFFKPEIADSIPAGQGERKPYVLPMPPPNVTGRLHMGHAMFTSIEDVLTRFHRMYGNRTLWLPGTDHAGIATQMLVEKQLAKEGSSRQEVGREAFLERVWDWKAEYGGAIVEQLRRLGVSTDWSREQFTLNENMSAAVIEAFVRLHDMGLISRGQRMVNWSPILQTAVSDLEVDYVDRAGQLYHFKYVLASEDGTEEEEHIPVATTRPETILGDAAVCVHPEDERYGRFVGRDVLVPMQGGRRIPVIADDYVDMEFGTGALKITPAHDFNDFEIAKRHDLPFHTVIAIDGAISNTVDELGSPQYAGLDRFKCRKQLWADMEEAGLTLKVEDHMQRVPLSQRSGELIEPLLSDQWFVNTEEMAQRAMDAVSSGEIRILPDRYEKTWKQWLEEKQPWCISRQLWWGHRIPVYYPTNRPDSDTYFVARSLDEALEKARAELGEDVELRQDPDVLDTWFSSGLWPFASVGWPDESAQDFKDFYPATILETGYDILFFWVARMVMMGITLTGKSPFREIYLHGLVRDENNQKMSKTKGNVVDPLDAIAKNGTDALRFSLLASTVPGMDVPLSKGMLDNAKSFANKIWNIGRFIITEYEKSDAAKAQAFTTGMAFEEDDFNKMPWLERALISKCHGLLENTTQSLLDNRFDMPAKAMSEFVWEDFASWYLEAAKTRLQPHLGGDPASARGAMAQRVLLYVLEMSLKLLHPYMPFVTEAVWQRLPQPAKGPASLMVSPWSDVKACSKMRDAVAEEWLSSLYTVVTRVRNTRAEQEIAPKERIAVTVWAASEEVREALGEERATIAWLTKADPELVTVEDLTSRERGGAPEGGVVRIVVSEDLEIDVPVPEKTVDVEKERQRLQKQMDDITKNLELQEKKLTPSFLEKAPLAVREKVLKSAEELRQQQNTISEQLREFEASVAAADDVIKDLEAEEVASRRDMVLSGLAGTFFVAGGGAQQARAEVGEGDMLPQGARQEDRIRRGRDAWLKQREKLTATGKEEEEVKKDWENTQGLLRRLYGLNDEMSYLSRGFAQDQQEEAQKIVVDFKKKVKEADKPAKAKDLKTFLAYHETIDGYLKRFEEMLIDSPMELGNEGQEEEAIEISSVKG